MLYVHVVSGLMALLAGALALTARKGSRWHRGSGVLFVLAMVSMTVSAFVVATWWRPNRVNQVAAMLTFYLVVTAWLTMQSPRSFMRYIVGGLMTLALCNGIYALSLGLEGWQTPRHIVDKVPAEMLFIFSAISLLAAVMDGRMLRVGPLQGAARLRRHLWRMTLAMWIATASFFLGQARFFPPSLRQSGVLVVPVILVFLLLIYWLLQTWWRTRKAVPALT